MSTEGWFDLADAAFPALVGMSLAAAAAAVPALLAAAAFRRRADVRHAAGLAALAVALLCPALARFAPALPIADPPAVAPSKAEAPRARPTPPVRMAVPTPSTPVADVAAAEVSAISSGPSRSILVEPGPPPTSWARPARATAAVAWLAGAVLLLLRSACGLARIARLRRDAVPFAGPDVLPRVAEALGIATDRLPPIATSAGAAQPMAVGVWRPLVLLPASLPDLITADALRDVLVHECAHALRRDPLVGLLQRAATALHWPSPFMHLLNRAIESAREDLCDNHALRAARPADYAATLLAVAELRPARGLGMDPFLAPPILARRGRLEGRVARLVDPRRGRGTRAPRALAVAMLLVATAVATSATAKRPGDVREEPAPADDPTGFRIQGEVVDPAGVPQPRMKVFVWSWLQDTEAPRTIETDALGRFSIEVAPTTWSVTARATTPDGASHSVSHDWALESHAGAPSFRLVLRPTREITVRVTDAGGAPVADAVVHSLDAAPAAESPRTDARGEAVLRIAAADRVDGVVAFKRGVGYDAFVPRRGEKAPDVPDRVDLVLDGVRPATCRVTDSEGRPVSGLHLAPWWVHKRMEDLPPPLATCREAWTRTGVDGLAVLDYLPRGVVADVSVDVVSREYQPVDERPTFDPRTPEQVVEVRVVRAVPASGRVLAADGSPVAGVRVKAQGFNTTAEHGHTTIATTAADGSYRLKLFPERAYTIGLEDEHRAARSRTQVIPPEGATLRDLDLRLVRGTILTGRVTDEQGRPIAGRGVPVYEVGGRSHVPSFGVPPRGAVTWNKQVADLWRGTITDAEGRYRMLLPPGLYRLPRKVGPWDEPVRIGDQTEMVYDYQEEVPPDLRR